MWNPRNKADMDGDSKHEEVSMQIDEVKQDWRDNITLASCAAYLSETKVMSDVTFTFKKYGDRKLQAHKLILSMRSAVFEAMFYGPMTKSEDDIDIEDVEPDTFDILLRYIYTDKTTLNGDTVLKCLYAAKKYCLSGLVKLCSNFLESSINTENVCTIYDQAKFFDVGDLKQKCYEFIVENSEYVFQNDDVANLSFESLRLILADEGLKSEEVLHFNMALRWAERKCCSENIEPTGENRKKVLGDILNEIRFPVMLPEEFAENVVPEKVLSPEEQVQVLLFMTTGTTETPGRAGKYITLPRRASDLNVDVRNTGLLGSRMETNRLITLISSHDIVLTAIGSVSRNYPTYTLRCEDDSIRRRVFKNTDFVLTNGELHVKQGNEKSVFLAANRLYTLSLNSNNTKERQLRLMHHVATFGEITITVSQISEGINSLSFRRFF